MSRHTKKSTVRIPIGKGDLGLEKHGYVDLEKKDDKTRYSILGKVLKDNLKNCKTMNAKGKVYRTLIKELTARATVLKHNNPKVSELLTKDHKWISAIYKSTKILNKVNKTIKNINSIL